MQRIAFDVYCACMTMTSSQCLSNANEQDMKLTLDGSEEVCCIQAEQWGLVYNIYCYRIGGNCFH
jgi:hypothetical protein